MSLLNKILNKVMGRKKKDEAAVDVVSTAQRRKENAEEKRNQRIKNREERRKKALEKMEAEMEKERIAQEKKQREQLKKFHKLTVKIPTDKQILKFTTPELIRLFGGWFKLEYAFSQPTGKFDLKTGEEIIRDYYICSKDVSEIRQSDRGKQNIAIKNLFQKDVYGMAIIAPSYAFGGVQEED